MGSKLEAPEALPVEEPLRVSIDVESARKPPPI
jgi:hypothetical protein